MFPTTIRFSDASRMNPMVSMARVSKSASVVFWMLLRRGLASIMEKDAPAANGGVLLYEAHKQPYRTTVSNLTVLPVGEPAKVKRNMFRESKPHTRRQESGHYHPR